MAQPQLQQNLQLSASHQIPSTNETLKGFKVRKPCGIGLIVTGIFQVISGSVLLGVRSYYYCEYPDYVGWGLWGGVFAITTGFFGSFSGRSKCIVITFMVLAIIEAVISVGGTITYGISSSCAVYRSQRHYDYDDGQGRIRFHAALYIILCVVYASQILMSILGASFTCVAVCPCRSNSQDQMMVMYPPQQIPLQTGPSVVYPVVIGTNDQTPTNGRINPPNYTEVASTPSYPPNKM